MVANSKIEWTHHTFSPWVGCTKISPACDHCYAESWAKRAGHPQLWQGERRRTRPDNWRQPLKWDTDARSAGERKRVFCSSLADVFDNAVPIEWRVDLLELIGHTTNLDWLLLTKRIGNAQGMLNEALDRLSHGLNTWDELAWPNVWIGATVANQEEADRDVPKLLRTPARLRFLSVEPMLGELDISEWQWGRDEPCAECSRDVDCECGWSTRKDLGLPSIDWVIAGTESGSSARPSELAWLRGLKNQCHDARCPFFLKQITERGRKVPFDTWDADLRVREYPHAAEQLGA